MEMKMFFDFGSRLVSSTVQAHAIGLKSNENGISDRLNLIKGKYDGIDFPVSFKQEYGNKLTDILDTGCASLYLISDKLKRILKENNLTGWEVFPIKLYDKKDNEIYGYHGFSVIGRSGPTSYKNSEIIEKKLVPTGPMCRFYKGISIDKWDGTDFFIPDTTCYIFVTKKAADILRKSKITNLDLKNLPEKEVNVNSILKKDSL